MPLLSNPGNIFHARDAARRPPFLFLGTVDGLSLDFEQGPPSQPLAVAGVSLFSLVTSMPVVVLTGYIQACNRWFLIRLLPPFNWLLPFSIFSVSIRKLPRFLRRKHGNFSSFEAFVGVALRCVGALEANVTEHYKA